MRTTLVISLIIAVLAVVFALQNPAPVGVQLGPFEVEGSTALILLLTFLAGVVVGALLMVPRRARKRRAAAADAESPGRVEPSVHDASEVPSGPRV